MKKAKKFVAECGNYTSTSSMSDAELYRALHDGQTWEGNMSCGRWIGQSKASKEIKQEYKRRQAEQERQAEIDAKNAEARIAQKQREREEKLNLGKFTTKQSFNQDRQKFINSEIAIHGDLFNSFAKEIQNAIERHEKVIQNWSAIDNFDKKRIQFGKEIIKILNEKSKNLKQVFQIIKQGKGVWWDVHISVEGGKTYIV